MTSLPAAMLARRVRAVVVATAGTIAALYVAGSGYYIVCHDTILSGILNRQASLQYAYEDRIAELRAALEAERSQNLRTDMTQDGALRDLAAKAARLAARADGLDRIVARQSGDGRAHAASAMPLEAPTTTAIATRLANVEARQRETIDAMTVRTERATTRVQAALADLGLAQPPAESAVGGPLVLLEGDEASIDALRPLEDAIARRRRIEAAADRLPLREPVIGPLDVTSGFGARRDPFLGRLALHTGVDLRQTYGDSVHAAGSGIVTIAGANGGYGTMIEVDHGNGYATRYAHLSSTAIHVGDKVAAGALVGAVGTTGRSTGPHLHYEVRIAGEAVDPARFLALAAAIAAP